MMHQLIAEWECQLPADHAGQGSGNPPSVSNPPRLVKEADYAVG